MRYLGIDYGEKRIGLSISDETLTIASSYSVLENNDSIIKNIDGVVCEHHISKIILGNPLNLNGSSSKKTDEVLKLKQMLESELNIEVILQDERLSTVSAEKMLIKNKTKRKNRKKVIDSVASTIILQTYLDWRKNNEKQQSDN